MSTLTPELEALRLRTRHFIRTVVIPAEPTRALIVISKQAPTPADYPRAVGLPAKNPL